MNSLLRPEIDTLINKAIKDFEELTNINLNEEQKVMFVLGFSAGLTTLKNFPEYKENNIFDLWTKLKISPSLNNSVKSWISTIMI